MCTVVDIYSATMRLGEEKEERRKIETTGVKYNGLPITVGGHNELGLTTVPMSTRNPIRGSKVLKAVRQVPAAGIVDQVSFSLE